MTIKRDRIPVWLVTGWLGSGKTTLLERWLRDPGLTDAAVVVNELGEVGLDDRLLASSIDNGVGVELLAGGCVCCTGLPGLEQALSDLFWDRLHRRRPYFSSVVVETTGLADPRPVMEALQREPLLAERYLLAGVITCIAATVAADVLGTHPEARAQVAAADLVVVTKADIVPVAAAEAAIHKQRHDVALLASAKASLTWQVVRAAIAGQTQAREPDAHQVAQYSECPRGDVEAHEHADHSHVTSTFLPLPHALPMEVLEGRITQALQRPPLRLKGAALLDDGRWVSVQWSMGDAQPVIEVLNGTPPLAGLTRISTAS